MSRRLAHIAFYLLLLVSGEEFDATVVDAGDNLQHAAQIA